MQIALHSERSVLGKILKYKNRKCKHITDGWLLMLLVLQLMNVERKLNEMKTNSNITVSPCRILLFFPSLTWVHTKCCVRSIILKASARRERVFAPNRVCGVQAKCNEQKTTLGYVRQTGGKKWPLTFSSFAWLEEIWHSYNLLASLCANILPNVQAIDFNLNRSIHCSASAPLLSWQLFRSTVLS